MNTAHIAKVDLNLLVVFAAVMECRSTTQAAARLGLTQPAISHALRRLRILLDDMLFVRTPRGMAATPCAMELAPDVAALLQQAERIFTRETAFFSGSSGRRFLLGLSDYAALAILPGLLNMLAEEAPGVTLSVKSTCHSEGIEMLDDEEAELLVGNFPPMPPHMRHEELFQESFLCAGRAGHPALSRKLTMKRYIELDHLQISTRGEPQGYVDAIMSRKGFMRKIKLTVPHFVTAPFLLQRSDLIATEPRRLLESMRNALGLAIQEPPFAIPCFTVTQNWHSRYDCDAGHIWLRKTVRRIVSI